MPVNSHDIEAAARGDAGALRRVLSSLSQGVTAVGKAVGVDPSSGQQVQPDKAGVAPRYATATVAAVSGKFVVKLTNPSSEFDNRAKQFGETSGSGKNLTRNNDGRRARRILHQLQTSTSATFAPVQDDFGPTEQLQFSFGTINDTLYFRWRSRFEDSDFNEWRVYSSAVSISTLGSIEVKTNVVSNATNNATVDSADGGTSATIRVYGPGGVGNAYTRYVGANSYTRNAGTLTGKAYSTKYYIYWDGTALQAVSSLIATLPDSYEFIGSVTTVAGGGGGGISGGGGSTGSGCTEVGTSLSFPAGSRSRVRLVKNEEWHDIELRNGRKLSLAHNSLVSVFVRVQDLKPGDLVEVENGEYSGVKKVSQDKRESFKQVAEVEPDHIYYGNGIRLHNIKPSGL